MKIHCPLCKSADEELRSIPGPLDRRYFNCLQCQLIFTHPMDLPTVSDEQQRYEEHENTIEAPGYVKFLNQAIEPALSFVTPGMKGLDYGSGPGPTLSQLLKRHGIDCLDYDPIFGPKLPDGPFDFIFSTEAFEHFHNAGLEMQRIDQLLKPGGVVTVMTMLHPGIEEFENWFYARDYTHVTFFSRETFDFICNHWNYAPLWADGKRVMIFRKNSTFRK